MRHVIFHAAATAVQPCNIISHPPKAIVAYVFAQYFFCFFFFFIGLGPQSGGYTGVHHVNLVLGRQMTQASAGGCHANNIR